MSLRSVGRNAFNMPSLEEALLPDELTDMGTGAFGYNSLKFNRFEGGLYLGGRYNPYVCFVRPENMDVIDLRIHDRTRFIYSSACFGLKSLERVDFSGELIKICEDAFCILRL